VQKNPENLKKFKGILPTPTVTSSQSKAQCKDLEKLHSELAQKNFFKILFPVIFFFRNPLHRYEIPIEILLKRKIFRTKPTTP